jgi:hypothetical protein
MQTKAPVFAGAFVLLVDKVIQVTDKQANEFGNNPTGPRYVVQQNGDGTLCRCGQDCSRGTEDG